MEKQTVLITGGTGVIGRHLTQLLLQSGYQVSYLSREAKPVPGVRVYRWDIKNNFIDPESIATADYIIHLAGAGIADERWTDARKREIIESRTRSAELLARTLSQTPHRVKAFLSASGIGYYGGDTGDRPLTESSPAGTDYIAQVVIAWEEAADAIGRLGIRTVKFRTGIVLTMEGGALPRLVQPVRLGAGAPLGTGRQYLSWIHIDDLCRLYLQAIQHPDWQGVYNAVVTTPVTNQTFVRLIAEILKCPMLLPNVPAFVIKLLFGEMAIVVLGGNYVLNERIKKQTNFQYGFDDLPAALQNLLNS